MYIAPASYCDDCRQLVCACATSVAEVDAWADAYLGTEAQAQDYFQACTTAQQFLASLHPGVMERPCAPAYLDDAEPDDDAPYPGDASSTTP